MDTLDPQVIKGRIVGGVMALASRTLILQILSLASQAVLAIFLTEYAYGVYAIVTAFTGFFNYFSDIGLAAALIQKKEEPSHMDLVTSFTVQEFLVGFLVIIGILSSSVIGKSFNIGNDGTFLFCALLIQFFVSSLRTIPSVLLERSLSFDKLVLPQILENFTYNLTLIVLAVTNHGVYSFAWAAIISSVIGLVAIYRISPWKIGFGFSKESFKSLIKFGLPVQANSILALFKDNLTTLFLGKLLPLNQIGYISWAKKTAELVLRLVMDNVIRVTFPAYSRLQHDHDLLKRAIEKSLFFLSFFIFPAMAVLVIFMNPLLHIVPRLSKWNPALISFYLFAFSSTWAAFSTPIVNALNAIGKIKQTLLLMIMWTALTWILIPILVKGIGYEGVSVAAAIIASTGIIPLLMLQKIIPYKILKPILKPFILTLILGIVFAPLSNFAKNIFLFISLIVLFGMSYAGIGWILMQKDIQPYFAPLLIKIRKKLNSK